MRFNHPSFQLREFYRLIILSESRVYMWEIEKTTLGEECISLPPSHPALLSSLPSFHASFLSPSSLSPSLPLILPSCLPPSLASSPLLPSLPSSLPSCLSYEETVLHARKFYWWCIISRAGFHLRTLFIFGPIWSFIPMSYPTSPSNGVQQTLQWSEKGFVCASVD